MEAIKINGHELTGESLQAIAEKILNKQTTYEKLPWMQVLQQDMQVAVTAGETGDAALLRLLGEAGHPYHFGFLSSQEYDAREMERLRQLIK